MKGLKTNVNNATATPAADLVQRKCAHCEDEERQVQKKEGNSGSKPVAPSIVHDVVNSSGGRSLDTSTRSFMEQQFDHDFEHVKVHDDDMAAKSADSINALAYTSGNNIVFNSGQYNPDSDSGKRLLAHELTHVVQQSGSVNRSVQRKLRVENPNTALSGTPRKEHWQDVRDLVKILSPGFDVSNTGLIAPVAAATCTGASRTVDKCFCDLHNAADDWKIELKDDEWPHTDDTNKRVTIQSSRTEVQFGSWGGGAQSGKRVLQDMWRVLGHELCGHAALLQRGVHPATRIVTVGGRIMNRPGHDTTVVEENKVAKDVQGAGAEERGLHTDVHSGESFGRITLPEFPSNSSGVAGLPAAVRSRLATIEKFMKTTPDVKADIIGHADAVGTAASNLTLSETRAKHVRDELVSRGIAATRFNSVIGVGETDCATPAPTPDKDCRKVEVFMYIFEKSSLMFP